MTTPRYRLAPCAGYHAIHDGDTELSDRDTVARLNAQDAEITQLRAALGRAADRLREQQHLTTLATDILAADSACVGVGCVDGCGDCKGETNDDR